MQLYLGFGANISDRKANIQRAISLIEQRIGKLMACSSFYETVPADMQSSHPFLNAAACFDTSCSPDALLHITQDIERELGRESKSVDGCHFDRPIDIDLLQLEGVLLHDPLLMLPHPELRVRGFVLRPLAELAPTAKYRGYVGQPESESPTFAQLLWEFEHTTVFTPKPDYGDYRRVCRLLAQLSDVSQLSWERYLELCAAAKRGDIAWRCCYHRDEEMNYLAAMAILTISPCVSSTKAWLEDVVVDQRFRRQGFARKLIDWAQSEALSRGASKLLLTSRPSRQAANTLYRSYGFIQRETNVYQLDLE